MVLAQRQNYGSMKQNRKSRDKSTHLETLYLWQRRQKYTMYKKQSLQQVVLRKLANYMQKNETRKISNTKHKNKLKMDFKTYCKVRNYKTLWGKAAFLFLSLTRNFGILLWMWVRHGMHLSQSIPNGVFTVFTHVYM